MNTLSFHTARHAAGSSFAERVDGLWSGAVQAWRTRSAMRAMAGMSDAALHDIGITRSEIEQAARYGRPSRA